MAKWHLARQLWVLLRKGTQLHTDCRPRAERTAAGRYRKPSLLDGGALEDAQEMAAHESPRTTKLYDRTKERLTQDEVERIRL
jgi:hypothetical protein